MGRRNKVKIRNRAYEKWLDKEALPGWGMKVTKQRNFQLVQRESDGAWIDPENPYWMPIPNEVMEEKMNELNEYVSEYIIKLIDDNNSNAGMGKAGIGEKKP